MDEPETREPQNHVFWHPLLVRVLERFLPAGWQFPGALLPAAAALDKLAKGVELIRIHPVEGGSPLGSERDRKHSAERNDGDAEPFRLALIAALLTPTQ